MAQGKGMQQVLEVLGRLENNDLRLEAKVDALREDMNARLDNSMFTIGGRVQSLDERVRKLEAMGKGRA